MANELAFSTEKCECGLVLTKKKSSVIGMKGNIPMGSCPKCGIAQPLVAKKSEPESEPVNP